MTHDAFVEAVERIPYQYHVPKLLYGLIRWLEPECVVEVGTHIGYAACWMARALQENGRGHLWCIDNWCWTEHDQKVQWEENLRACGVRDMVTLIEGRSQQVEWPDRVDLAYIDGNHTFGAVQVDAVRARAHGAKVIVLHDATACEGVARMADQVRSLWPSWDVIEDTAEQGVLIAKRQPEKPAPTVMDTDEQWDVVRAAT